LIRIIWGDITELEVGGRVNAADSELITGGVHDGGVQISCDEPKSECVHWLEPEKYVAFLEANCQPAGLDVIEAARLAVKKNKRPVVFKALHELAEVKFSWYDWDSPFYGDKGVQV